MSEYSSRRTSTTNPVNPILYAAREDIVTWADPAAAYRWWADDFDLAPEIPEQRDAGHVAHARKVLSRLANLAEWADEERLAIAAEMRERAAIDEDARDERDGYGR